ncbi:MAG: hypothetical protein JL50_21325 [Peptococcaceae bacterium BICA1-7]|nr:MAG: hypothetical protein JL50_21325 [Peptococcaceae bacterium BICA1-7]HBV97129.1 ATPase [Desulfotomaculum sp.]
MKIALPVSGGRLCPDITRCERLYIYDVSQGSLEVLRVSAYNHLSADPGLLPELLSQNGVGVVIAGEMDLTARELFSQNGIKVEVGVTPSDGRPEDIVRDYLSYYLKA